MVRLFFTEKYFKKKSLAIFSKSIWLEKLKLVWKHSRVDSSLLKSWSPGVGWGRNGEYIFAKDYIEKTFQKLLKKHLARKTKTFLETFLGSIYSDLLKL